MLRIFSQIVLILIFLMISFCVYLSVYGINTDKFNGIINEKISQKDSDFDKAAEDIRLAIRHLGMLVGKVDVEQILGSIFNDFCIGK